MLSKLADLKNTTVLENSFCGCQPLIVSVPEMIVLPLSSLLPVPDSVKYPDALLYVSLLLPPNTDALAYCIQPSLPLAALPPPLTPDVPDEPV